MSTLRTNAILDASGGTTATVNGIPLRPGVLDPENRIINGAFDFWQRGTSFSSSGYGADRWYNGGTGTFNQSRQAFTVGDTLGSNSPTYFLRHTTSGHSASSDYALNAHNIEGVRNYAGQTITVLGWARRSSGSGNMAVSCDQFFGTGGSPSSTVNGAGQTVTLTSSWAPLALTFSIPSISGKTLGTNNNDYLGILFWSSAGSNYNARTNSLGLQTIGVDLWGIHIKQGTHTTSAVDLYRQPELGPELARCQRYYQLVDRGSGMANATTTAIFSVPFVVEMRVAPGVGQTGVLSTSDGITNQTQSSTGVAAYDTKRSSTVVQLNNFTGLTVARAAILRQQTSNSLVLDAEL